MFLKFRKYVVHACDRMSRDNITHSVCRFVTPLPRAATSTRYDFFSREEYSDPFR